MLPIPVATRVSAESEQGIEKLLEKIENACSMLALKRPLTQH